MLAIASDSRAQQQNGPGIQRVAQYFRFTCITCHGAEGKGDGPVAAQLNSPPTDLTKVSHTHNGVSPSRQVYDKIEGLAMPAAHGSRDIPNWGAVLLSQELGTSVIEEDSRKAAQSPGKRLEGRLSYLDSIQQ